MMGSSCGLGKRVVDGDKMERIGQSACVICEGIAGDAFAGMLHQRKYDVVMWNVVDGEIPIDKDIYLLHINDVPDKSIINLRRANPTARILGFGGEAYYSENIPDGFRDCADKVYSSSYLAEEIDEILEN